MLVSTYPPKKNCCGCGFLSGCLLPSNLDKRQNFCCLHVLSQLGKVNVLLASFTTAENYLLGSDDAVRCRSSGAGPGEVSAEGGSRVVNV